MSVEAIVLLKSTANYFIFEVTRQFAPKNYKVVRKKFELWYRKESGKVHHYPQCMEKRYSPLKSCKCEAAIKEWLNDA